MPVVTRSQNNKSPLSPSSQPREITTTKKNIGETFVTDNESHCDRDCDRRRRRRRRGKITTSSYLESNIRTYKLYTPKHKSAIRNKETEPEQEEECRADVADASDAAEALLTLQYQDTPSRSPSRSPSPSHHRIRHNLTQHTHMCMNPMNQISIYLYRIGVYNISQTLHYKTAYILYNEVTRNYYVYSIISNQITHDDDSTTTANSDDIKGVVEYTLPIPQNTIQLKFTSHTIENIQNYIMTVILPSNEHDYYIQDDIIGLVISDSEFREKAFNSESCYYDISDMMYDNSSSETTTGFKAFTLIPSRHFWYSPEGTYHYSTTHANTVAYRDKIYNSDTLYTVLTLLPQYS